MALDTTLILDGIRNSASSAYQDRIPEASRTNFQQVGQALMAWTPGQNEFLDLLVNKIGLTIVNEKIMKNKLARFKKGVLPFGDTIEEIFVKLKKGKQFDRDEAENTLYKRNKPEIDVIYHKINNMMYWDITVEKAELNRAFTSPTGFTALVSAIVQSIYSQREIDEYIKMKELFSAALTNDHVMVVENIPTTLDTQVKAKQFVQAVKRVSKGMEYPSKDYNAQGLLTYTKPSQQILFVHKDVTLEVSTELLASAFNKGEFDYNTQIVELDGFGSNTQIQACLVDVDWLRVYDTFQESSSVYNNKGLYWNYFLHHHQLLSYSTFVNAVFFISGTKPEKVVAEG